MVNKRLKVFVPALLAGVLIAVSGCVSKKIEPEYIPRVATSDNGKGTVTLSWKTRVGYKYQIYVRDDSANLWVPLKNGKIYRGSGKTISVEIRHNTRKPLPWYSVRARKIPSS